MSATTRFVLSTAASLGQLSPGMTTEKLDLMVSRDGFMNWLVKEKKFIAFQAVLWLT
jgi:hypothetical protein